MSPAVRGGLLYGLHRAGRTNALWRKCGHASPLRKRGRFRRTLAVRWRCAGACVRPYRGQAVGIAGGRRVCSAAGRTGPAITERGTSVRCPLLPCGTLQGAIPSWQWERTCFEEEKAAGAEPRPWSRATRLLTPQREHRAGPARAALVLHKPCAVRLAQRA